MLQSRNIKPILVFDGRHLPAKAMTELKRRETRDISKKRAAELLSLGKIDEARSFMRRSVDITHAMALALIKECRKRNIDCIVAPYEADAQLAYLNIKNYAQLVITEDSDLILFGCTKVLFKMDLEGNGTLVETIKLPLVMKCPIEHYTFDKFRRMCILSGCDYLNSLPGIGLAKARQFVNASQDTNFANALKKLPSFFNRSLQVSDDYRENFLKAEATFKHQYVYDPSQRCMTRLTPVYDEEIEAALCSNAGELLDPQIAFQLALGNLDPFTLKKMDNWDPDSRSDVTDHIRSSNWKDAGVSNKPSIWSESYKEYLDESQPWMKKVQKQEPIISTQTRSRKKVVTLTTKYVPETQDDSLSIETLSGMYCMEPASKKQKVEQKKNNINIDYDRNNFNLKQKSPILENKGRSFKKCLSSGSFSVLKKLSAFPRTVLDDDIIESKFFSSCEKDSNDTCNRVDNQTIIQESPEKDLDTAMIDTCTGSSSQKENSPSPAKKSPILVSPRTRNPFKLKDSQSTNDTGFSESVIENTCPIESEPPICTSPIKPAVPQDKFKFNQNIKKTKAPAKKVQSSQPTLLSMFGFQKKPVLKR
ncbi:exonuclease [Danaus plexippus plexippus]|uniref:Exonuclease 1 n=1 Tax=Danaus plexippus plexippus TaxID=278856 RepID=A0A212EI36_DANPL|nr:exonuclease [Danaus plexippus plexippus]